MDICIQRRWEVLPPTPGVFMIFMGMCLNSARAAWMSMKARRLRMHAAARGGAARLPAISSTPMISAVSISMLLLAIRGFGWCEPVVDDFVITNIQEFAVVMRKSVYL